MGFVHQIECLKDLRYDSQTTPYFSKIDSRLGSARYEADRSIASEFPKAYEHLDVQCNTYIESESGAKYVDLLRTSKGLLANARINSDLQSELPMSFLQVMSSETLGTQRIRSSTLLEHS